jgi:Domain of unknown function (DUF6259)
MTLAKDVQHRYGIARGCAYFVVCWLLAASPCGFQQLRAADSEAKAGDLKVQGDTATFTTSQMIVVVSKGRVTRIFNRVTGTEFLVGSPVAPNSDSEATSGLIYAEPTVSKEDQRPNVIGPTLTKAGETVLTPKLLSIDVMSGDSVHRLGPLSIQYDFRSPNSESRISLVYSLESATGDLLVQESASGERHGLSGIRWGFGPVVCRGNLLLPAFAGIKAARPADQYKFESSTWGWPMGWQVPIVVFADKVGGFSVDTEDPAGRFKEFMYQQNADKNWQVAFTTVNQAPFEPYVATESVTWRLNTFAGDWTAPVDRYKRWAYQAFQMSEKEKYRPKWVDDIKLVIKHADYISDDQIVPYLDALEKHVKPSETLLFLTFYKDDEEKQPIPYWLPNAHGIKFVKEARRRGFHVMYFANYIGIQPNNPKFAEFKDHVIRDPFSGKPQGWNLEGEWAGWDLRGDQSATSNVMLYYVNPAYKPWRDFQIQQFKQLFAESPADGLFLDQAFLLFNDGNGTVDGLNTIRANLQFHRDVAEALPGVALGGESVNEITMQYESFCELHFLSLDLKDGKKGEPVGWWLDPAASDRMVPFTTLVVSPHTRPIGYVGFPETSSPYYEAWRDALHTYGGIPTITRPTLSEIEDSDGEVRRVMRGAFSKQ